MRLGPGRPRLRARFRGRVRPRPALRPLMRGAPGFAEAARPFSCPGQRAEHAGPVRRVVLGWVVKPAEAQRLQAEIANGCSLRYDATVRFDLRQLGWKAFQDLSAAVAAEVLQRPVQTFLPVRDGGRDGAFVGTWDGAPKGPEGKSTIQCKFTSKADAKLALSQMRVELGKVAGLAARGLAHDYIVMTNAGVTGEAEAAISQAFQRAGAKVCRVFDGGWIMRQILERPRLRMMVPRLYGLLGLDELITGPAYEQARAILDGMGHDLASFVPTASHRAAVKALQQHGFVLLLGDPASGKSTIAAALALGALDDGCTGAVKISSPDQLHLWRPGERQFLWVDDAFGATQYEPARVQHWNVELPRLRAAVRDGTRVVFTSRNYIWERARQQLKATAFPQLRSSQVVVDVQALSPGDRARILYNHVRNGGLSREARRAVKPFLAGLAENPALTPEIARRLGDPFLTRGLRLNRAGLKDFVERPRRRATMSTSSPCPTGCVNRPTETSTRR